MKEKKKAESWNIHRLKQTETGSDGNGHHGRAHRALRIGQRETRTCNSRAASHRWGDLPRSMASFCESSAPSPYHSRSRNSATSLQLKYPKPEHNKIKTPFHPREFEQSNSQFFQCTRRILGGTKFTLLFSLSVADQFTAKMRARFCVSQLYQDKF